MNEKMDAFDFWKLCDKLSLFQAALLILGVDPAKHHSQQFEKKISIENVPLGYEAIETALVNAVNDKVFSSKLAYKPDYNFDGSWSGGWTDTVDVDKTILSVQEVKELLASKGIKTGFFFAGRNNEPDYLDPLKPHYAPKLAAAVGAWQAVTSDGSLLIGKSPKKALEKWLRENANKYALTKDDGSPNETGIDEVSKVANWKPEGGATKTPVGKTPPTPETRIKSAN